MTDPASPFAGRAEDKFGETIATEIVIAASPERVWAALSTFRDYPEWNPYLIRIEGEPKAGSDITVHAAMVADGEATIQQVKVVSVTPPFAMRWEGGLPDRALFRGDHWWMLEPINVERTRVRHFEHFSGTLVGQILGQHREALRGNFVLFNEALKRRVEGLSTCGEPQ